jgi:Zn-dependent protease with chaperone function
VTEVAGTYFDGRTSASRPVHLRFEDDGSLRVIGTDFELQFARSQVRIDSRLGNTPRFVRLPGDARFEVADNDRVDAALATGRGHRGARLLHRLEASWRLVLFAIVVLTGVATVLIVFGLPLAAKHLAFRLPMTVSERMGSDALSVLDRAVFKPSQLPPERQADLEQQFQDFLDRQGDAYPYNLVFRASPVIGANALALPNGTLVMTDELVELAETDDEIIAVLAHECGHVQGRHALRSILQNSAVVVVITLATGDVSAVSALGAALPTLLLESKYSRVFETEADAYGVHAMLSADIDPAHLANILERLTKGSEDAERVLAYISSHPATVERVLAIKRASPAASADAQPEIPANPSPAE